VSAYDDMPTVVVVLVPVEGGLLMIRRGLADGYGQLALPGGYQMRGESWQEAGAREVLEETGLQIAAEPLRLLSVVTTPDRRQNLLFCESQPARFADRGEPDGEVLEVLVVDAPVRTAFPTHDAMVAAFFAR
jgi:ADP-ribose pyrophosphatase YjhB (NUDIX family)